MADHLAEHADMLRISADFWDRYSDILQNFRYFEQWAPLSREGAFADADMIPFGKLALRGPVGLPRHSNLSYDERTSLFVMWCLQNSPLMIGGALTGLEERTLRLLTNPDLIHLNNMATHAEKLSEEDGLLIWMAADRSNPAIRYLAAFNITDNRTLLVKPRDFMQGTQLRELLTGQDIENTFQYSLRPHGACVFEMIR